MSDPANSAGDSDATQGRSGGGGSGQSQRVTNAILGTVVLLAILVLANYVFNQIRFRFDLTENGIFTLTDGTKSLFEKNKENDEAAKVGLPVTIRFYAVTDSDYVSQFYLARASGVEDFLKEYENAAGGLVTVKRYNPEPFSEDEKSADFDGLPKGVFDDPDNPVYFGIVIECEGRKEVLPFLPARPEELLEYDVTRAILRVSDADRKVVGIMTSMEIGGGFSGNFGAPPTPPWYLVQSLQNDYDVRFISPSTPLIPDDTDVLVVMHPYDLLEDAQFSIDQYLLGGGRVLVTVDPMFFAARYMSSGGGNPMMPQQPSGPAPTSDLNQLFAAWGVKFDSSLVLADMASQTRIATGYAPTVLSVSENAMNQDDPVTAQLSDLFIITPGAFELIPKDGIDSTVLVSTSQQSQMVGSFDADPTQREAVQRLVQNFKADKKQRVIAARLSGTFQSAFPNGLGGPDDGTGAGAEDMVEPIVPADDDDDDAGEANKGAKDSETQKDDVKPADAKPADAKPEEVKSDDAKPDDARPPDAGTDDARPADAGAANDAGPPPNAGTNDAGPSDAGPSDAGASDARSGNAGPGNAGTGNAGSADARSGNAGTGNAGTGNAGTGNAGTGNAGTGNAGTGNAGTGNAGTGNAGTGNAGTGNAGTGNAGAADAGSGNAGSADAGTGNARPGNAGSGNAGSGNAGSGNAGSGNAGAADAGTGNAGTGNAGTGNARPGNARPGNARPGNAGSGNAGSGNAGAADAGTGNAGTGNARPGNAGAADAGSGNAGTGNARPGNAGAADAGSGNAGTGNARPGNAGAADAGSGNAGLLSDVRPETGGPEEDEAAAAAAAAAGADAPAPEEAEDDAPAPPPLSLKSSEKEGVVVVIADSDFVYDSFAVQQVQMEDGRIGVRPVNGNLALFENALEQLAGGEELIRVRSRSSNHRPFTRLNRILEEIGEKYRPKLDEINTEISRIEGERQLIGQNILSIISQNPDQLQEEQVGRQLGEQILKMQEQEEELDEKLRDGEREKYEINKEIKSAFEEEKNSIILWVTGVLPGVIIIFGIGLALTQRARTAAR